MVIAIIAAIFGAGFMTGYYLRSLVSRRRYDDAADNPPWITAAVLPKVVALGSLGEPRDDVRA